MRTVSHIDTSPDTKRHIGLIILGIPSMHIAHSQGADWTHRITNSQTVARSGPIIWWYIVGTWSGIPSSNAHIGPTSWGAHATLQFTVNFTFIYCWVTKYIVCRVCSLVHVLKPSSHRAGLYNIWFADLTLELWALGAAYEQILQKNRHVRPAAFSKRAAHGRRRVKIVTEFFVLSQ